MDRIGNVKELITVPKSLQHARDYRIFVDTMKADLQIIPISERKKLVFELVCYVCSICELFFMDRKMGALKKKACMECLEGFDKKENISRFIEISLDNNIIEKKTFFKKTKLYIKKNLGQPKLKNS